MGRRRIPQGESLSREQLANERTLLSWARIGINMIGAGVLVHTLAKTIATVAAGSPGDPVPSATERFISFSLGLVVLGALVEVGALVGFLRYRSGINRGILTSPVPVYLLVASGFLLLGIAFIGYVVVS